MDAEATQPASYAKRLAGYISDPSTIRVRTLEQFGRAPTIERIKSYQQEIKRLRSIPHNSLQAPKYDGTKIDWKPKDEPVQKEIEAEAPLIFSLPPWKLAGHDAVAVITMVAGSFGLSYGEIVGHSRAQYIVRVRALIATLLVERGNSLPQVGRWMRRDHSTVSHARDMLPTYAQRAPAIGQAYDHYRKEWGIGG